MELNIVNNDTNWNLEIEKIKLVINTLLEFFEIEKDENLINLLIICYFHKSVSGIKNINLVKNMLNIKETLTYERVEFFGDKAFGYIVSKYLFTEFPNCEEGELTLMQSKIVGGIGMNIMAKSIPGISSQYVFANINPVKNNKQDMDEKTISSITEDLFEAIMGTIAFYCGIETLEKIWVSKLKYMVQTLLQSEKTHDYISELQITCQKYGLSFPKYEKKNHIFTVFINGIYIAENESKSDLAKQILQSDDFQNTIKEIKVFGSGINLYEFIPKNEYNNWCGKCSEFLNHPFNQDNSTNKYTIQCKSELINLNKFGTLNFHYSEIFMECICNYNFHHEIKCVGSSNKTCLNKCYWKLYKQHRDTCKK